MKKKFIAVMLSVSLVSLALSGCGNSQEQSAEVVEDTAQEQGQEDEYALESGKVSLVVWGEENVHATLQKMIDSFKQKYAGQADFDITLEVQSESTVRDYLLGDIHNGADVITFPDDQLSSLIAGGALVPIPDADAVRQVNTPESVDAASYNGVMYAYPMTADNGYFLYYNKDYFSESDVETFDGILEAAQAAEKQVSMDLTSGWYLYSFFGLTGLDFGVNDDGVTNHCNWNSTEGDIKGADIAQAILDITTNPAFVSRTNEEFVEGVNDGSLIAGVGGVWQAMDIRNAWGDDYGAVKLPTYTCAGQQVQMASFTGFKMMGVNAYSEHKGWALKLAEWMCNEENQTLRFVDLNQGPSNINAAASEEVAKVPAIQAIMAQSQYGTLQRVGNKYWDACTSFANTMIAGNPNGLTMQELMDTLVAGITASTVQ